MTFRANQREATAPAEPNGRVPRHVAIIMDGNGRWAAERGLPRTEGHRRGMEAVRRTVDAAIDLGIETITLFSFSSENWSRPAAEVSFLFGLIRIFIRRDLADLHRNGVRITVIGERANVPADIVGLIEEAETLTAGNTRLNMVVAFNYGSRGEIVRAVRRVAEAVKRGEIDPAAIDEATIGRHLDTAAIPDPDLLIRTSGELRLSNFLLWQVAYSELVFLPLYWPDFGAEALRAAVREFASRDRRYGGVAARSGA
ncbi:MAG: isoprenyl transferase [Rhizobiales bacterium]|nr:isoprenyl transferase [Hyphomicrobiales bacterium]MBN9010234.1 isoprenyl transferase [Hyphomicrobiales bacterium]